MNNLLQIIIYYDVTDDRKFKFQDINNEVLILFE